MLGFIVHADTYKSFDGFDFRDLLFHFFEDMYHSIFFLEFPTRRGFYIISIIIFLAVVGNNFFSIFQKRDFSVLDFLARDSRTAIHVESWIDSIFELEEPVILLHEINMLFGVSNK